MFKITITPIVLAVLAVTASKEGSNDITRRLLGEDYNNIDGVTQGGQEGKVDVAGGDNGLGSRSPPYSPHIDASRVLGVKNDKKVDGPLMMKAQDGDDDNRDNGSMMMAQTGDDNGLESRHGGYVRGNDYFKRDYYDKPYYPRYRATEGGESDGAAFSMMMANEGGNPDDAADRWALMDGEAANDNRIALASRYGGYRHNDYGYNGYNGYRRNYYKNNGFRPYWANEGGDNEMESFSSPVPEHDHGKIPYLANEGGKPIDDDAAQGVFMANEGGNPEMDSSPFPDILPARYGRYGRNDYYRNNRYDRYYKNGGNDYYNGYDRQYRNGYNNDDRYRANEAGNNQEPDAFGIILANEGGNPDDDDAASPWAMMDGNAGDNNDRMALGSRYGGYRRNDYGYNGYNGYRRNYYKNNGFGPYRATEGNDAQVDSFPIPDRDDLPFLDGEAEDDNRIALANQGGKPKDDGAAQGVFMANDGGNPEDGSRPWSFLGEEAGDGDDNGLALGSRYGRYGRNDYYRNNRYDRYYRNGHNDYYNGYDKQYRNRYNDGFRYRANEGGNNEGDQPQAVFCCGW